MTNTEAVQHAIPSGSQVRLRIADDHGPDINMRGVERMVANGYRHFMRSRGLLDEERDERLVKQAAKAREIKAKRRACK